MGSMFLAGQINQTNGHEALPSFRLTQGRATDYIGILKPPRQIKRPGPARRARPKGGQLPSPRLSAPRSPLQAEAIALGK